MPDTTAELEHLPTDAVCNVPSISPGYSAIDLGLCVYMKGCAAIAAAT